MRRLVYIAVLAAGTLLPALSHAESWEERQARADQARARERCLAGGLKADSPDLQACIRATVAWMAQNRRLQQRILTD